jgi:hypothetical protein
MAEKKETAPTAEELAAKEKAETESAEKAAAEAKAKKKAKPHEVELKDKDTGFYDQETGFKVVRDQRVPLGDNVGKATQMAIESGRLLLIKD